MMRVFPSANLIKPKVFKRPAAGSAQATPRQIASVVLLGACAMGALAWTQGDGYRA